jgi:hypothetical protein
MNGIINREIAQRLMEIKGEARGTHLKNDADFVIKEKGKEGLKTVEKELEKIGYPIYYKKINQFGFYPAGLRVISLLAIKKVFNWPDEKIRELGAYAMKFSWVIRILMKYFYSIDQVFKETQKTWSKYFTVGELKVEESNIEKKYVILQVQNLDLHPIYCRCLEGVFLELAKMILKPEKITCQEIECFFRGGKGHRFLIKWK